MSVGVHPTYEDNGYYSVSLPEILRRVLVSQGSTDWAWTIQDSGGYAITIGTSGGAQAAANAAERYLVKQAELTLKLAGRKAR